jgi:hypothetical protein
MPIALRRILYPRFVRRPLHRWSRQPFGRLVRHFLARLVRGGQDPSSEFELGIGGLLGLLAAPGIFNCFLLIDRYSTFLNWYRGGRRLLRQDYLLTSMPDKYLFIAVAMAVAGFVAVLKWDQLLPDSQDYLNLAPLPVHRRSILLANAMAITIGILVVAIDVSTVPSVLFPMLVMAAAEAPFFSFLQFVAAHAISVLLASVFSICAAFAILGGLSAILPRDTFRACVSWVRGLMLLAYIALLLTGFGGAAMVRGLQHAPDSLLRFLPSLWFLGLYQGLQHRPLAVLPPRLALISTAAAVLLTAVVFAWSYRRRFAAVLEGSRPPADQRLFAAIIPVLDWFGDRLPGFPRACHLFVIRALLRSEAHRLAIAVSIGLGWMLALPDLLRSSGAGLDESVLAVPLELAYLLILGLRVAFELPASVSANWIFRVVLDARETEPMSVVRRVVLAFLTPLVLAPSLIYSCWRWGPLTGATHLLYVLALCACLTEILFAGYRKVPLTCPMPGFRDNFLMLILLAFVGFEVFTRFGAGMERWMFHRPWAFALVPLSMAWTWRWNRRRLRDAREAGELEEGVTFENAPVRAVERLNLSDSM